VRPGPRGHAAHATLAAKTEKRRDYLRTRLKLSFLSQVNITAVRSLSMDNWPNISTVLSLSRVVAKDEATLCARTKLNATLGYA
jgi:hypothetical protein